MKPVRRRRVVPVKEAEDGGQVAGGAWRTDSSKHAGQVVHTGRGHLKGVPAPCEALSVFGFEQLVLGNGVPSEGARPLSPQHQHHHPARLNPLACGRTRFQLLQDDIERVAQRPCGKGERAARLCVAVVAQQHLAFSNWRRRNGVALEPQLPHELLDDAVQYLAHVWPGYDWYRSRLRPLRLDPGALVREGVYPPGSAHLASDAGTPQPQVAALFQERQDRLISGVEARVSRALVEPDGPCRKPQALGEAHQVIQLECVRVAAEAAHDDGAVHAGFRTPPDEGLKLPVAVVEALHVIDPQFRPGNVVDGDHAHAAPGEPPGRIAAHRGVLHQVRPSHQSQSGLSGILLHAPDGGVVVGHRLFVSLSGSPLQRV